MRHLQTLLAERDETLRAVHLEKSRLEVEVEGYSQRLRGLDESEQRYKDENWSLETQTHELIAAAKEAADREQRLSQSLSSAVSEKIAAQRELDEFRQTNSKLVEDHAAARKSHESELSSLRRNVTLGDSERGALQRKVEELNSQNQELAKAVAGRFRDEEVELPREFRSDSEEDKAAQLTPEHSPPPSPTKGTPRHSMLESETLKSSLNHAHRMIQNLKGNIHREKSEKLELKHMLQEARDELELRRGEPGGASSGSKRRKEKASQDQFKKPAKPSRLGGGRSGRTDVLIDETGWEDHVGGDSPDQVAATRSPSTGREIGDGRGADASDAYQTANETEDAFDTANERDTATETEAFQTGAESLAGDSSDELTETEVGIDRGRTIREKRQSLAAASRPGDRKSFMSTASDSTDDDNTELKTPVQAQPQRYRLKINRGAAARRSRADSEALTGSNPSSSKNSPASFIANAGQGGQTLFAELGELEGGESEEEADSTPSKVRDLSRTSTPGVRPDTAVRRVGELDYTSIPKLPMVDSVMMTDPWEPATVVQPTMSHVDRGSNAGNIVTEGPQSTSPINTSQQLLYKDTAASPMTPSFREVGTQRTPRKADDIEDYTSPTVNAPRGDLVQSAESDSSIFNTERPILSLSGMQSEHVEPRSEMRLPAVSQSQVLSLTVPLELSFIQSLEIRPVEPSPSTSTDTRSIPAATPFPTTNQVVGKVKTPAQPQIAEDETSQAIDTIPPVSARGNSLPFKNISANIAQRDISKRENLAAMSKFPSVSNIDQGSQTILSSEQIDSILDNRGRKGSVMNSAMVPATDAQQTSAASPAKIPSGSQTVPAALRRRSPESPTGSIRRARANMIEPGYTKEDSISKSFKRPNSSGSIRTDSKSYPPLPPDHREAIAAAAQKAPSSEAPPTTMGPPLAPASAYKVPRPKTPIEQHSLQNTGSKGGTTPRPRISTSRSQVSHRSSFSSFASELDERFNIRTDGMPMPYGLQGGTDPRMIQAITQTMIGEYLWKYTRKTGRADMSDTRHRRFFWVHPYTRTLYWSNQDPSAGGRAEQRAKSVAIESVRVVTDDNPMPPGLHRKSLVVVTPGRTVKFTATTGQRHETWFNALAYLLLRPTRDNSTSHSDTDNPQNVTSEDVDEFNPTYGRNQRSAQTRTSMSSYNSRTTNNTSPRRNLSNLSIRRPVPPGSAQSSTTDRVQKLQPSQGSVSRLSHIFKPGNTIRGSFSSRHSRQSNQEADTIYDAPAVHDSAEDLRQVIEKQDKEADRLENVRACCDGTLPLFTTASGSDTDAILQANMTSAP